MKYKGEDIPPRKIIKIYALDYPPQSFDTLHFTPPPLKIKKLVRPLEKEGGG